MSMATTDRRSLPSSITTSFLYIPQDFSPFATEIDQSASRGLSHVDSTPLSTRKGTIETTMSTRCTRERVVPAEKHKTINIS